jgi:hypothetical protein
VSRELDERRRAREAKQLLELPIWEEALSMLESGLVKKWRDTKFGDVESRESAWHSVAAIEMLRSQLKVFIERGVFLAAKEAEESRKRERTAS